jgi:biotin carboxyl carrier protein
MKYFAAVGDHTYEIVVDGQGTIHIDGEPLRVDIQQSGRLDLYSLLIDNKSHEVVVEADSETRNTYHVLVTGAQHRVVVQNERTRRLASAQRDLGAPAGKLAIKAPIPGLVVKTPVAVGQQVERGETLIILEAMKMENELRAPRAGVVREIRVQAGDQVNLGQLLLYME